MEAATLIVRNATHDDTTALVALLSELFSIEGDFSVNADKQRRGIALMLDGCGKHRCIRVAERSGRVIGMGSVQTLLSTAEGGMVGLIEDVIVEKKSRGKGVGRKLLQSLEAWADQHGLLRLQLLADQKNRPAIQFYLDGGWIVTDLICIRKMR